MVDHLEPKDPQVIAHLQMLQGVINRMAGNSAICKTLCMSLVAGIAAFSGAMKEIDYLMFSAIPIVIFAYLDSLYLALERGFRNSYNTFVKRLHDKLISPKQVFQIVPDCGSSRVWSLGSAFFSWSVFPVYAPLLGIIFLIYYLYG